MKSSATSKSKFHTMHINQKITHATKENLKNHTCPRCMFDGTKKIGGPEYSKSFPSGFIVEYVTHGVNAKGNQIVIQHAHCPACGFWDRESFVKELKN